MEACQVAEFKETIEEYKLIRGNLLDQITPLRKRLVEVRREQNAFEEEFFKDVDPKENFKELLSLASFSGFAEYALNPYLSELIGFDEYHGLGYSEANVDGIVIRISDGVKYSKLSAGIHAVAELFDIGDTFRIHLIGGFNFSYYISYNIPTRIATLEKVCGLLVEDACRSNLQSTLAYAAIAMADDDVELE